MSIHGISPKVSGEEDGKRSDITEDQQKDLDKALIEARERKRLEFLKRAQNG